MATAWREVQAPVLHLVGEKSHFQRGQFDNRSLDGYFRDSRTITVPGAGHWLHHDQTVAAVDAIRGFFGAPPPRTPHAD